jgi:hypothetical protein
MDRVSRRGFKSLSSRLEPKENSGVNRFIPRIQFNPATRVEFPKSAVPVELFVYIQIFLEGLGYLP